MIIEIGKFYYNVRGEIKEIVDKLHGEEFCFISKGGQMFDVNGRNDEGLDLDREILVSIKEI